MVGREIRADIERRANSEAQEAIALLLALIVGASFLGTLLALLAMR